ncbi:bifunctional copper resistance protein CopD/cytochrome c oxidase assembly protein [Actinotalea ferrariae]|uniref:cytochrome c oxidase assembly protein n=1 Tax=Actinotalea ferrariae TaxID=1386098 RepID=UPI001C8C897D|nr:cytochrome c oxidase assembly protein [Actinotalea ferrariae]MBX9243834.1 bifunctional copper resistance protein CopD/cytochrome c oxidase assembly protein [Actinotalea ferrariae]
MSASTVPARRLAPAAVAAGLVVALLVTIVAAAWSGALAPTLLDPGVGVRWGLPLTTVVSELAASTALGALVLAAFVLPRDGGRAPGEGRAWPSSATVASVAAGVWAVATVTQLVLQYAAIAGRPVGGPEFGAELGLFVTQVSLGRTLLGVTVVAALTCVVALLVTRPVGALITALLVTSGVVMLSTTGHTAGSTNHELAVSSMFLHLIGAAVWIGALAALAVLAGRLYGDLAAAVTRFSSIAAWCFVAVAVSGTVNALQRLDGPADLSTRYGVLLVAKVVLFSVLGLLGLLHRRTVVSRLAAAPFTTAGATVASATASRRAPAIFWRLVAVELAVMGAVSGVAVALGSTAPPTDLEPPSSPTPAEIVTGHPLPPAPTVELWLTSFRWDLIPALGCLAAVLVYGRWVLRLRRRGDRWPAHRTISLVAGMVLLAWTTSGGPSVYGHVLFSAHMLQHMALVMVVPILVVLSAPVTLAARALPSRADGSWGPREWILGIVHSRVAQFFANPVVAAINFAGSMFAFYFTDAFELALTTYLGHLLTIAHFTLAGYLFVNALIGVDPGPKRPGYALRLLLLFATMAFHAFFGLALVSSQTLLVPRWFGLLGRPWGPSALADQHAGGAIAWGVSELPMLVLAIGVAVAWTREDERTARRRDRAADRDGDAELVEYNAMLERLAQGDNTGHDEGRLSAESEAARRPTGGGASTQQ